MKRYWTFALTAYLIIPPFVWGSVSPSQLHQTSTGFFGTLTDRSWQVQLDPNWRTIWGHSPDCPETNWFGHLDAKMWFDHEGTHPKSQRTSQKAVLHAWASDWIVLCQIHLRYKDKCSQANIDTRTHFMLAVWIAFSRKYNLFFFKRGGIVDSSHADWFRFG